MGCTATDPSSGQRGRPGDFSKLFRRVYPAVLRLAVDLDETTRTLFSKLSMQLVRWFSQVRVGVRIPYRGERRGSFSVEILWKREFENKTVFYHCDVLRHVS